MDNKIIVVPDGKNAGLVTWWRLSGTINYDALTEAWASAGLDAGELPDPPSDSEALKRAIIDMRGPHTLIRQLPNVMGFAVVDESFDDGDPEYEMRFKLWLDYDALEMRFDPAVDAEQVREINERFATARRELVASDLSSWLVRRVWKASAVALRDTGGIYFVPETQARAWEEFADVFHKVGASRVHVIPAMKSERAVEAVMAAVIAETEAEVAAVLKRIENGELGGRALKTQAAKCDAMADKLRTYEQLLGVRMGDMQRLVQEADARVSMLLLAGVE